MLRTTSALSKRSVSDRASCAGTLTVPLAETMSVDSCPFTVVVTRRGRDATRSGDSSIRTPRMRLGSFQLAVNSGRVSKEDAIHEVESTPSMAA